MDNKKPEWIETTDRFVAYFDIMGFKDFVYRHDHKIVNKLMDKLSKIIDDINEEQQRGLTEYQEQYNNSYSQPILFSDSIIMFSNNDSIDTAMHILAFSTWFMVKCLQNEIPIKGALSYGEITVNLKKSIFFGKPLIDAYTLCNSLKYYGAIIDNKFESFINKNLNIAEVLPITQEILLKYKTNIESKKITHQNLNWMFYMGINKTEEDKIKTSNRIIENFYNTVSGEPRIYVDNTIEFIEFYEKSLNQISDKK